MVFFTIRYTHAIYSKQGCCNYSVKLGVEEKNGSLQQLLDLILENCTYPVIYNANFSHVDPLLSLPIGGEIKLVAKDFPEIIVYPCEDA